MALTGIQIFKLLPKTNCKECGVPTCLAFAMNLASGKAELDACPYVSDEARELLAEASAPPIRLLTVGYGDTAVKMGGETVLYRHEKTFFSPPGLAALITDDTAPDAIAEKCRRYMAYQYERVGLNLRPELIALKCVSGDAGKFAEAAKLILDKKRSEPRPDERGPGNHESGPGRGRGFQSIDLRRHGGQCRSHGSTGPGYRVPPGNQGRWYR